MFSRLASDQIKHALAHFRVVAVTGPRQSGKSTLVQAVAGDDAIYRNLDEPNIFSYAQSDPSGFLDVGNSRLIIDEIQRVPELILPIKARVDKDTRPGQFLITGSADLFALRSVQDSLAGRVLRHSLLPLAQVEIYGTKPAFLATVFAGGITNPGPNLKPIEETVASGGFPEALTLPSKPQRRWLNEYAALSASRYLEDVAQVNHANQLPALLTQLALRTSQTVNLTDLGNVMQLNRGTVDSYVDVLERLFLISRVKPWFRNEISRLAKTPKLHFVDSGVAAALCRYDPSDLAQRDRFGHLLETFVFAELSRLMTFDEDPPSIFHLRSHRGEEVDFILETWDRRLVAIEVKANATPKYDWFKTMRILREALGPAFVQGITLYTGKDIVRFDDRMIAAPISCLWGEAH